MDYKSGSEFVTPFPDVVHSCEEELGSRGFPCRVRVVHGGVCLTPLSSSPGNLSFLKDLPVRELDLSECPMSVISSLANLQLNGLSLVGSMLSDLTEEQQVAGCEAVQAWFATQLSEETMKKASCMMMGVMMEAFGAGTCQEGYDACLASEAVSSEVLSSSSPAVRWADTP